MGLATGRVLLSVVLRKGRVLVSSGLGQGVGARTSDGSGLKGRCGHGFEILGGFLGDSRIGDTDTDSDK